MQSASFRERTQNRFENKLMDILSPQQALAVIAMGQAGLAWPAVIICILAGQDMGMPLWASIVYFLMYPTIVVLMLSKKLETTLEGRIIKQVALWCGVLNIPVTTAMIFIDPNPYALFFLGAFIFVCFVGWKALAVTSAMFYYFMTRNEKWIAILTHPVSLWLFIVSMVMYGIFFYIVYLRGKAVAREQLRAERVQFELNKTEVALEEAGQLLTGRAHNLQNTSLRFSLLIRELRDAVEKKDYKKMFDLLEALKGIQLFFDVDRVTMHTIFNPNEQLALLKSTDPAKILRDAVLTTLSAYQRHGTELEQDIEPNLPPIRANYGLVLAVFANALENASKYNDHRNQVAVRMWHDGNIVMVQFTNTGRGIPEHMLANIGNAGFRGESEPGTGSGIGVWFIYKVVQMHGGKHDLTSEVGKETTLTIGLPVA